MAVKIWETRYGGPVMGGQKKGKLGFKSAPEGGNTVLLALRQSKRDPWANKVGLNFATERFVSSGDGFRQVEIRRQG